eukprot:TRINITY_DN1349_c0_g1_i2.p1 TRINITY_DN1349_c0_g1~~TRINITY_DN1349_c0_g1_i2.p1  ORF type:complete len:889 (+),score=156.70 TRINITY_DN1349_c0_g1_i2:101-2767(+)
MRVFTIFFLQLLTSAVQCLIVNGPESVSGHYRSIYTTVYGVLPRDPLENFEVMLSTPADGCYRISTERYDGKIVMIDRGTCLFTTKLKVAQDQGAAGVIMVNRIPGVGDTEYDKVGGISSFINIPSMWISYEDGFKLKQVISNLTVTFKTSPIQPEQREALTSFVKEADQTNNWRNSNALLTQFVNGNKSEEFDPCQSIYTDGTIVCDEFGYITSLSFGVTMDLRGTISKSLEKFSKLIIFEQPNNRFQGQIPDVFYSMKGLSYVNLMGNSLNGTLPLSLLTSASLFTLKLQNNQLSGNLNGINLTNIRALQIDSNALSGRIPDSLLLNSRNVVTLTMGSNGFTGNFSFPNPIILDELDLSSNRLSGSLQSSFKNVTMRSLKLSNNLFSGNLTEEMIRVAQNLDASSNSFSLFSDFEAPDIVSLIVSNNPFNSKFPSVIADRLRTFEAANCGLQNLPDDLRFPQLQNLDFSNNPLNTDLEVSGAFLGTEMISMKCRNCGLRGNVVMFYQSPTYTISVMDLSHNYLFGNLDLSYFSSTITSVDFSYNNISGVVSDTFNQFTQIQMLNMQGNPNMKSRDGSINPWLMAVYPTVPILDSVTFEYCPALKSIQRPTFQVVVSPSYYNFSLCYCGRGYFREGTGKCSECPAGAYCPGGALQYSVEYPASAKNSTIEVKSSIPKNEIIGIVVGASVFILIIVIVAAILVNRRRRYRNSLPFNLIDLANFNLGDAKSCVIDEDEISNISEIGRGAFGIVYKGTWRQLPVAIKQMKTHHATIEELSEFVREVSIIKGLRAHPNVVLFLGITFPPQNLSLITELCEGGSLYQWIRNNPKMVDTPRILEFLRGISRGMIHLTLEGVVHRDLASRNILLSGENLRPKVRQFAIDFFIVY